ncbi:hypothetical protein MATL_G00228290 [Megalops atlanticus]|uniref:Uncharacterized protein n=1 Tax=Megalops atlanticus TaxID=7932 RepID=A0A9D3PFN3_MEGAT|nr:hypothetical protein MATL_G00228290 [Megalops atlanticus]
MVIWDESPEWTKESDCSVSFQDVSIRTPECGGFEHHLQKRYICTWILKDHAVFEVGTACPIIDSRLVWKGYRPEGPLSPDVLVSKWKYRAISSRIPTHV